MHPVLFTSHVLAYLAALCAPVGGAVAAVVVLTLLVRLVVHPLTRAAVRGERARSRLAPKVAEIRRRYAGDVARQGTELTALHRAEGISPFAGLGPLLVQAPVFLVLFAAFRDAHGPLAGAHLFGVPLSTHAFAAAGAAHVAVYAVLFATVAALAWATSRRAAMLARVNAVAAVTPPDPRRAPVSARSGGPRSGGAALSRTRSGEAGSGGTRIAASDAGVGPGVERLLGKLGRVLPYALLVSAAVLPLASVIYLVTTTAWSAVENAALRRGLP